MQLGDTTMESRAAQQAEIRKLVRQYQLAVHNGRIKVNPVLAQQISEQARRTQGQEMER